MGIDKEDMQAVIKWLVTIPIILFIIYYSFSVVFCNNIYKYAYRYITEISYTIMNETLIEVMNTLWDWGEPFLTIDIAQGGLSNGTLGTNYSSFD